jgi:hypothetical protein
MHPGIERCHGYGSMQHGWSGDAQQINPAMMNELSPIRIAMLLRHPVSVAQLP